MSNAPAILPTLQFKEVMHFRGPEAEAIVFKRGDAFASETAFQQAELTKQRLRDELAGLGIPAARDTGSGISEGYYFMVSMHGDWEMRINGKRYIDALKTAGAIFVLPSAKSTVTSAQPNFNRPLFELSNSTH
jgi:hypothetical protein